MIIFHVAKFLVILLLHRQRINSSRFARSNASLNYQTMCHNAFLFRILVYCLCEIIDWKLLSRRIEL